MSTIQPTTSLHSVGSQGRRYSSQELREAEDAEEDALLRDAELLSREDDEQTVYSLSEDGRLLKKRYSRSQLLNDDNNDNDGGDYSEDEREEVFILPQRSAPTTHDDEHYSEHYSEHHSEHYSDHNSEHRSYHEQRSFAAQESKEKARESERERERDREGRPYQHAALRPVATVGSRQISLAEARLFGLLDKDGKLRITDKAASSSSAASSLSQAQRKKYFDALSRPAVPSVALPAEDAPTFRPSRSEAAQKAMRNPRCGYDFMDRLDSRGAFLDRVDNRQASQGRMSKAQIEAMEMDYEAKHDKLQCPKCLMPQTFKEFFEKQRTCTRCQLKFTKLNVTSGLRFTKKNEEREQERLAKLRAIEMEMYGAQSESRIGGVSNNNNNNNKNKIDPSKDKRTSKSPSARSPSPTLPSYDRMAGPAKNERARPKSATISLNAQSAAPRPRSAATRLNKTDSLGPRPGASSLAATHVSSRLDATAAVDRMVKINNDKAAALSDTLGKLQEQLHFSVPHEHEHGDSTVCNERRSKTRGSEGAAKPPLPQKKTTQSPRRETQKSKFDRLVDF